MYVAALHMPIAVACDYWSLWVSAGGAEPKLALTDEVSI
jgi:hypothetical protein